MSNSNNKGKSDSNNNKNNNNNSDKADSETGLFVKYPSIENAFEDYLAALKSNNLCTEQDEWIGTEKIHGTNFGIYSMDYGDKIQYAKRNSFIAESEMFFGYQAISSQLETYIRKMRELVESKFGGKKIHTVIVMGELFGGKYEHPAVPKSTQTFRILGGEPRPIIPVQTNLYPQYSPDLHFYAFDVKYRVNPPTVQPTTKASTTKKSSDPDDEVQTLPYDDAAELFAQVPGLLYAKPVVRGTMDVITAFDVEKFETTIPALLGLGEYPLRNNWAEGIVVRHAKTGTVGWKYNDARYHTILKIKKKEFKEVVKRTGDRDMVVVDGVEVPFFAAQMPDKEGRAVAEHLLDHICTNRLNNVVTKIGPGPFLQRTITPDEVAQLLAEDALTDFNKQASDEIRNKPKEFHEKLSEICLGEAKQFVEKQWKSIRKFGLKDAASYFENKKAEAAAKKQQKE